MAFTYDIAYRNRNFTTQGDLLADYAAKYEVVFVEGLPFKRQTEENDKPLVGRTAADEEKRYEQTFAERRRMSIEEKRDYLRRQRNLDIPSFLPELFSPTVEGEETIDGRAATVVECVPKPDARPADEEQKRAMRKQVNLWIDREDLIVSRIEATLLEDDASLREGSTATIDFSRIDGVWVPKRSEVRFVTKSGDEMVRGDTEETNSRFQRFRVDVRLLDGGEVAQKGETTK